MALTKRKECRTVEPGFAIFPSNQRRRVSVARPLLELVGSERRIFHRQGRQGKTSALAFFLKLVFLGGLAFKILNPVQGLEL